LLLAYCPLLLKIRSLQRMSVHPKNSPEEASVKTSATRRGKAVAKVATDKRTTSKVKQELGAKSLAHAAVVAAPWSESGQGGFEELSNLPLLRAYETAFEKATGLPFRVVPPEAKTLCHFPDKLTDTLCDLVAETSLGCLACRAGQKSFKRALEDQSTLRENSCFTGMTAIAIPVLNGSRHVGTLVSGHIFQRERSREDFEKLTKQLGAPAVSGWKEKARKAYFKIPVIPPEKFQAIAELLNVFAIHLPEDASRHALTSSTVEPIAVSNAKNFVNSNYDVPFTLEQVLQHVHVSRFHFCKIFKKTTGITLTEYTARIRVEKAKALLHQSALRITDVAFASGFGSIPQFNNVFRRIVGMPPTEYRSSLRADWNHA
jgi:AraC-like DNA-binding protein/ligand-binding sensor protein